MTLLANKTDLTKADKQYYAATRKPAIVDLDIYYYLTIEGQCAPEDPQLLQAIEALYKLAYPIKFKLKELEMDFVMPKMEGFWWVDQEIKSSAEFKEVPRSEWRWKLLIRMPDFVEEHHFSRAQYIAEERNTHMPMIKDIKFEKINEGRCAQILHIGSYEEEEESLEKLYQFISDQGHTINNYHHEIYLSDPRRTPEHKLRTILRYGIS
ncbi:MAG: GyrI-like domain-containing protein [Bacteroidota bacterium]